MFLISSANWNPKGISFHKILFRDMISFSTILIWSIKDCIMIGIQNCFYFYFFFTCLLSKSCREIKLSISIVQGVGDNMLICKSTCRYLLLKWGNFGVWKKINNSQKKQLMALAKHLQNILKIVIKMQSFWFLSLLVCFILLFI